MAEGFLRAFAGDRLHFVDAKEFVARACQMLGVSSDELVRLQTVGDVIDYVTEHQGNAGGRPPLERF